MKVKVSPYRWALVCDECDEEVGENCVKDKLHHYGTEQLCEECICSRGSDYEKYDEVDIDYA